MCEPTILNAWKNDGSKPIYNCDSCSDTNCKEYCFHHKCDNCGNIQCPYNYEFDQMNEDFYANRP